MTKRLCVVLMRAMWVCKKRSAAARAVLYGFEVFLADLEARALLVDGVVQKFGADHTGVGFVIVQFVERELLLHLDAFDHASRHGKQDAVGELLGNFRINVDVSDVDAGRGKIGCRRCLSVRYRSQCADAQDRAHLAIAKIEQRLITRRGRFYNPKGMPWRTFHRLCDRYDTG
jgi:hypothetical protein